MASILDSYQPDLPLAVASGVTFFEMNHHETPQMLARTYFLKDRAAAMRTDKTNYFYEFVSPDDMQREGFPIRGETERYQNFVRQHRRFLLWSSPRTWVIQNLQRDGASVVMHADYEGAVPYGDTQLYLVTMPSGQ